MNEQRAKEARVPDFLYTQYIEFVLGKVVRRRVNVYCVEKRLGKDPTVPIIKT